MQPTAALAVSFFLLFPLYSFVFYHTSELVYYSLTSNIKPHILQIRCFLHTTWTRNFTQSILTFPSKLHLAAEINKRKIRKTKNQNAKLSYYTVSAENKRHKVLSFLSSPSIFSENYLKQNRKVRAIQYSQRTWV